MSSAAVLRALSDLSPRSRLNDVRTVDNLTWLGLTPFEADMNGPTPLFPPVVEQRLTDSSSGDGVDADTHSRAAAAVDLPWIDRSARIGRLTVVDERGGADPRSTTKIEDLVSRTRLKGQTTLDVMWLIGVGRDAGSGRKTVIPLAQCLVSPDLDSSGACVLTRATQWGLGVVVQTRHEWDALVDTMPTPRSKRTETETWVQRVAEAAHLSIDAVVDQHPSTVRPGDGLTICVGMAFGPVVEETAGPIGANLLEWAERPGIDSTAFAAITDPGVSDSTFDGQSRVPGHAAVHPSSDVAASLARELAAPVPLTRAQFRVVESSRTQPVTVVSGAPGTGKSHCIVALCADALARGESVLIATRSIEAANVVADLLGRQPGPGALRFGSPAAIGAGLAEISRRMASPQVLPDGGPSSADVTLMLRRLIDLLGSMHRLQFPAEARLVELRLAAQVPGLWAPSAGGSASVLPPDVSSIERLLARARATPRLFPKLRSRRALKRLAAVVGAEVSALDLRAIDEAIAFLRMSALPQDMAAAAAEVRSLWPLLQTSIRSGRQAAAQRLDTEVASRLASPKARGTLAALDTAFRSGPSARRNLLGSISADDLRKVAPLWIGTLGEAEQLLPDDAGLFDRLIIDEASQVDLALAAPALLRARRVTVIGDPRQLRHVSFVPDDAIGSAFSAHGLTSEIGRLNPRRNSVLDMAASVAPVLWLDEHHRSLPHLVEFSLREFYDREVTLLTRHPSNEASDCIDVIDSTFGASSSSLAEAVIRTINRLRAEGETSIGVITPFRDMADALTEAVLGAFDPAAIDAMQLMVATAHGFQGAERQVMIVVPGVDPADTSSDVRDSAAHGHLSGDDGNTKRQNAGRRRFCEDPNLFNVLVSRARRRMMVLTAVPADNRSLLGRFVQHSTTPPAPLGGPPEPSDQRSHLAEGLAERGAAVRFDYPVGEFRVDVVATNGSQALGVMWGVHPDGPEAHVRRHLALAQAGWDLYDLVPATDAEGLVNSMVELQASLDLAGADA